MLKQQLENQIDVLKEQIHTVRRMNDEHYANRAQMHCSAELDEPDEEQT